MSFWPAPDESNASCHKPGIYKFTIEGEGIYVRRFTRASRVQREYVNNIRKLVGHEPYRRSDPDGFRYVHVALYRAVSAGKTIQLEIVENVPPDMLNDRERYWREQVPEELRLNGRRRPR